MFGSLQVCRREVGYVFPPFVGVVGRGVGRILLLILNFENSGLDDRESIDVNKQARHDVCWLNKVSFQVWYQIHVLYIIWAVQQRTVHVSATLWRGIYSPCSVAARKWSDEKTAQFFFENFCCGCIRRNRSTIRNLVGQSFSRVSCLWYWQSISSSDHVHSMWYSRSNAGCQVSSLNGGLPTRQRARSLLEHDILCF